MSFRAWRSCAVDRHRHRGPEVPAGTTFDDIISRTLAYAIVTGLLVGLYAGPDPLAMHVLSWHSAVAVAAATLAAAALFSPVWCRVQRVVDRGSTEPGMTPT